MSNKSETWLDYHSCMRNKTYLFVVVLILFHYFSTSFFLVDRIRIVSAQYICLSMWNISMNLFWGWDCNSQVSVRSLVSFSQIIVMIREKSENNKTKTFIHLRMSVDGSTGDHFVNRNLLRTMFDFLFLLVERSMWMNYFSSRDERSKSIETFI